MANQNGNPISPSSNSNGSMLNWNGQLTEASIQATSGTYQNYGKISFPVMNIDATFSQDIVEHKRPNVPGARVESVGSNPIVFKVKAPFLFGLQRGNGETWDNLYPASFYQVLQILNDQVAPTITFTHSTLGQFTVKPKSASAPTDSNIRNGQILEFELVSANVDDTSLSNVTTQLEFGLAQSSGTLFDQQFSQFLDLLPVDQVLPDFIVSWDNGGNTMSGLLQQVSNAFTQTTLYINSAVATVNNAVWQITQMSTALASLDNPGTAPLQMQLERCQSGVYSQINNQAVPQTSSAASQLAADQFAQAAQSQQQLNAVNGASNLGVFVVNAAMTLGNVCLLVHNTADQIIMLNPALSKVASVPIGTQVVFYGSPSSQPANALVAVTTQL
jgi:hypothetical protein